jgi:AmmeMemoRadiSam system protein A
MALTDEERKALLQIARKSIESVLLHRPTEDLSGLQGELRELRGVFVTLKRHGELRGCIGYVEPRLPLAEAVQEVAQKAAFEDPRFLPLTMEEWPDVDIEISILSPLERVTDVQEIEVGKHGLVIDAGFTRGLLLPQVATEYHWDREQFLRHTAIKAGLPPDAWQKSGVRLYKFTTETFGETSASSVEPQTTSS